MDDRGFVIVAPRQARMSEARPQSSSFKNLGLGRFDRHDDCRSEKGKNLLMPRGGGSSRFF